MRAFAAWLLVLGAAAAAGSTAAAAEPQAIGWWHRAATDSPAVGLPIPTLPAQARPTTVPVPSGSLYVANDPVGPRSVSALRFDEQDGSAILTLRLGASSIAPLGARILACPVASPWEPVAGGRFHERPQIDCATGVPGAFVEDRSAVAFEIADLATFAAGGAIELALAPAPDEVATFDLVFDPPTADSLRLSHVAAPATPPVVIDNDQRVDAEPVPPPAPPRPPVLAPPRPMPPVPAVDDFVGAIVPAAPRLTPAGVVPGTDGPLRAAAIVLLSIGAAAAWLLSARRPIGDHLIHPEVAP